MSSGSHAAGFAHTVARFSALAVTALLCSAAVLSLSGCTVDGDSVAQSEQRVREKQNMLQGNEESRWVANDAAEKLHPKLPPNFPVNEFTLPDGARFSDAGQRSESQWFLVLKFSSEAAAHEYSQLVSDENQLVQRSGDDSEAGGSGLELLSNSLFDVDELLVVENAKLVLLSYEIRRIALPEG